MKSISTLIVFALLAFLITACGGPSPSPAATLPPADSTLAVPSNTGGQATSASTAELGTPVAQATATEDTTYAETPSGAVATAEAPGNLPDDLANAVNKTKEVKAVRYEILSNVTFTQNGQPKSLPDFTFKGEGNGVDQHISFSGVQEETGSPVAFEFIQVGGETYEKGLSMSGLDPNVWYKFPRSGSDLTQSTPNAKSLLADLDAEEFRKGNFQSSGIEILDLQPCRVWSSNDPKLAEDFGSIASNEEAQAQLKAVDKSEFKIWTCGDGYMHQIKGRIEGHNPDNASDKASVDLTFHIYDFNANITIAPPPDAREFTLPSFETPTP